LFNINNLERDMHHLRGLFTALLLTLIVPFAWAEPNPLPADAAHLAVLGAGAPPIVSAAALPLPDAPFTVVLSALPAGEQPVSRQAAGADRRAAEPGDGDGTDEGDPLGRFKPGHPVDEGGA
jgi:hypothetical protein